MNENRTIMIVDDDEAFALELKEALNNSGYRVVVVNDPAHVRETVKLINPDAVLVDLKMPRKNGFQIAGELRFLSHSRIPVIAMSGFSREYHYPLVKIMGMDGYLEKPFSMISLIAKIESALARPAVGGTA